MVRMLSALILGAAFCASGLLSSEVRGDTKSEKPEIKGGIEAKVKSVDTDKGTLTITTTDGKDRILTVENETMILGPRGGIVRRRLNDPRFHAGLEIIIVVDGTLAKELHLGYDRKESSSESAQDKTTTKDNSKTTDKKVQETPTTRTTKTDAKKAENTATQSKTSTAAKDEDEDDDEEFPGKIKRADSTKHMLVITLLNGKDRSFLLARDVKITVKGVASKQGLDDPALKSGIPVTVVTEQGGRKVKEVQVAAAAASRSTRTETKKTEETPAKSKASTTTKDEDEEEFVGKIKSADSTKHMLVVTLDSGKDRSFLLAKDVKIMVKGIASKQGLDDPALKAGIPVTVVTAPGGRKVKEVQVAPLPASKKKAG